MDLKLDGYTRSPALLNDAEFIRRFIVELAKTIEMQIINGPTVVSFKETLKDPQAGLSAFAIVAESHIAVHTWPETGYIWVDVVSCRPFRSEDARKFIIGYLLIKDVTYHITDISRPGPPLTPAEVVRVAA